MRIFSRNIQNGFFDDAIGHRGTQFLHGKKPNRSFHLGWDQLPAGTQTLALTFIDHDAIPVCGFTWIHWAVANIDPALGELPENASNDIPLLEGITSWASPFLPPAWSLSPQDATGFGGCAPPDKTHVYTITVYALDTKLPLQRGFYLNELLKSLPGHVLDKAELQASYHAKGE